VISVVGGIMSLKTNDSRKNKGIALLCIGIIIMLVTIFVNFNR
jgi:glucose uptake protein GlcU